ncbi:MAG TPA: hypothetical protein VFT95_13330 [Micromonosporaceae bacterium]|nr:hypothetical protein [Micromonosporaceae bacterium]
MCTAAAHYAGGHAARRCADVNALADRPPIPRATWHRRTAILPLAYLAAIVALAFAHPFVTQWRWLLIHVLLLGTATNAIVIWSSHFAVAILRAPAPASRRLEAGRLGLLNAGVVGVLAGGAADLPWVGVAGAGLVFAAVAAHTGALAARLRRALPARFAVTVRYYLAAGVALLTGVPVGAWMLVVDDAAKPRLVLFHAHVNLLGWITLTVLGTVLTFWPTVLRTRMADDATRAATAALPVAAAGLGLLGLGVLAWWPVLAAGGLSLVAAAVVGTARPAVAAAAGKPPSSFAAWSIACAGGWLLVALAIDAWTILAADDPADAVDRFGAVLVPLLAGFVAQVLVGALSYLLPVALGGGPATVQARAATLDRHWAQRVTMANAALAAYMLPTPPYVRISTSLLVLAALLQFLVPAGSVLLRAVTTTARR